MARLKDRLAAAASDQDAKQLPLLDEGAERFANIPVEFVEPDPDQPRKHVGNVDELKASITAHGIIQPIVVSPHGPEMFRIIAGERRFTAVKELGLPSVPAIIRTVEEHHRLEIQLIENIHRQELSPIEEAQAFQRLMDEFKLSQRQLAKRLGKSPAGINQTLRILSLPSEILDSVQTSERLTRSVLLEIAKLESEEERLALWQQATNSGLTVKAARQKKAVPAEEVHVPKTRVPFTTKTAVVMVTFAKGDVSPEEVVDALAEALKVAKLKAKTSTPEPVASV
jgi:ParB family chromosome partitioning protein